MPLPRATKFLRTLAGRLATDARFRGRFRLARWISGGRPILRVAEAHLELALGDYVSDQVFGFGMFEPATLALARRLLAPGDVFVDVGAHIGLYSVVLGAAGCRVVALEPNQRTFEHLRRNIALNALEERVLALPCAATPMPGVLPLHLACATNSGGASLVGGGPIVNHAPTLRLDAITGALGLDDVTLAKVDAEGSEPGVLESLGALRPRHLILEWNGPDRDGATASFAASGLASAAAAMGYAAFDVHGRPAATVPRFAEYNVHLVHQGHGGARRPADGAARSA